jgi:putative peptide zinc metalloprotease protein
VRRGDLLGYVLPEGARHVMVLVSQADIDLIHRDTLDAEMLLPGALWSPVPMRLLREVPAASDKLPSRALANDAGGQVAVDTTDPQDPRSLQRWFQLEFELPEGAVPGHFGNRVHVRFDHGTEPLGLQWWRRGRQLLLARLDL